MGLFLSQEFVCQWFLCLALRQDTVKCSVALQIGSSPAMAFFMQRQYSQKKGTLTKFAFFEFPLMIYDEKTDVSGVISKFLVVDYVMHFEPRTLPSSLFSET